MSRPRSLLVLAALLLAALPPSGAEGPGSADFRGRFDGYEVVEVAWLRVDLDAPEAVPLPDDNMTEQLELGFATRFYDDPTAQFWVGSNGFVSVFRREEAGCCQGQPLPSASDPDGLIAGFWTDLDPSAGGIGFQRFPALEVPGLPAQRALVVDYAEVPGPSGTVSFQVRIFEDGAFEVAIEQAAVPQGVAASVGAEDHDGSDGVQVLHGDALSVAERAWRFTPIYVPLVPDLVVAGIAVDRPPQPTLPWTLTVAIRNDGIGPADQSQIRLSATPEPGALRGTSPGCTELIGAKVFNGLQPGQRANVTFTWAAPFDPANPAVPRVGAFRFDASGVVLAAAEAEVNLSNNAHATVRSYVADGVGGTDVFCTTVPVAGAALPEVSP